ncbi:MAG: hypothetical protein ACRCT8_08470, partial [Lacipirellulaceae bacterium]
MLPKPHLRLIGRRLRRRPLLGPLLAATVALNLVVWLSPAPGRDAPVRMLAMGFFAGQVALLGSWLATSLKGLLSRVTLVASGACLLAAIHAAFAGEYYSTMLTFSTLAIAASALACSVTRWAIERVRAWNGAPQVIAAIRRQFSIGALFAATTALAVVITIVRWFNWDVIKSTDFLFAIFMEALFPALALAMVTLTNGWRLLLPLTIATVGLGIAAGLTLPPRSPYSQGPSELVILLNYFGVLWGTCLVWLLGLDVRPRRRPKNEVALRVTPEPIERPADESAERPDA